MKRLLMFGLSAIATAVMAAEGAMSLSDAQAKLDAIIENPSTMGDVVRQLDKADQTKFLGQVNSALAKFPGSQEERAAKFLKVNSEAVNAGRANGIQHVQDLMAEVYATSTLESLTVINESFGDTLLSRKLDPNISNEDYEKLSTNLLATVISRTADVPNANVRNTFAILTLLRGDNGQTPGLRETLVGMLDSGVQNTAKNEWIPAALGEGQDKTYDPMLGAGVDLLSDPTLPNYQVTLGMAGPLNQVVLLSDIGSDGTKNSYGNTQFMGLQQGGSRTFDGLEYTAIPRTLNPENKWYGEYKRGDGDPKYVPVVPPYVPPEPGPYFGQLSE